MSCNHRFPMCFRKALKWLRGALMWFPGAPKRFTKLENLALRSLKYAPSTSNFALRRPERFYEVLMFHHSVWSFEMFCIASIWLLQRSKMAAWSSNLVLMTSKFIRWNSIVSRMCSIFEPWNTTVSTWGPGTPAELLSGSSKDWIGFLKLWDYTVKLETSVPPSYEYAPQRFKLSPRRFDSICGAPHYYTTPEWCSEVLPWSF